jgi:hypothetical protein
MKRKKGIWRKILDILKGNKPSYKSMWVNQSADSTPYQSFRGNAVVMDEPLDGNIDGNITTPLSFNAGIGEAKGIKAPKDPRIEKKPIEVFQEIFTKQPIVDLIDLDKKIGIVKKRIEVLQDYGGINPGQDERRALMYLKNRKNFKKTQKSFSWPTTNNEMVGNLCGKYKLRMAGLQGYYKCVPAEGVEEIKKFGEAFEGATSEEQEPQFHLIIDDGGKETRKDPILLAESPFGDWYYVLGAWDKEVEVVDEIIYQGK